FFDKRSPAPFRLGLAHPEQEIPQQLRSVLGVLHLHVELRGVNSPFRILHGGDGVCCVSRGAKSYGEASHVVSMAVPNSQRLRHPREQLGAVGPTLTIHSQVAAPIFPPLRLFAPSPERVRNPLHAIANSPNLTPMFQ